MTTISASLYAEQAISTYRLAGIQLSNDQFKSIALIEASEKGFTSAYQVKDTVGQCLLTGIEQSHVNLLCDHTVVKLQLEADPVTLPTVTAATTVNTQYTQLDRSLFSTVYKDKQRFVNDLDVDMVVQDNQIQGVQLYHRHQDSMLRTTGLQDGDIVREVNGYTVMQMDKVIEQFRLLKKEQFDQIKLLITRGDVPMMLVLQFN